MSSYRSFDPRSTLRVAVSGSLLAAAAAACLSGCSGHAASAQVQPALPGHSGTLGGTYVLVTPADESSKAIYFNVTGQVPAAMQSEICARSSLEIDGSVGSLANCRWFVDKANNDVGQLRFAATGQPSLKLRLTLRAESSGLTLTWAPTGFFGGGVPK